ncbi:glycosyltransferase family 4 protein [Hahella aquimaris]|uniref:glycosyltransferase family 4 protein n=1 Tax=Hahella sp. HNIBRBA332 TaxID=3015983 RepID=UPI00273AB522|nr:glycosyltransferase family 4 protein [Hahella sp. HNIBRBA332]WLQ12216.1 glycosyltransferase family 4 protein [Hahella sp. HNIBRBA332]
MKTARSGVQGELKICIYTDTFFPRQGGAQVVLHHLATELTRRGIKVVVLAPHFRGDEICDDDYEYRVVRFKAPGSKKIGNRMVLLDLLRLYLSFKFDLLHCHAAYPQTFVARSFKRLVSVPVVCRPHGNDIVPDGGIRKSRYVEKRLRLGMKSVDIFVAQGAYMKSVLMELMAPENKIVVINNGVDNNILTASQNMAGSCGHYALAMGRLSSVKGFDNLIRAMAKTSDPKITLKIAGHGPDTELLGTLIRKLGLNERVELLGHVDGEEKVRLLKGARLFINSSRKEAYSNAIVEAIAMHIPVIASDVGGNREIIEHSVTGLTYPVEDTDQLAEAISVLWHDGDLRKSLAEKAYSSVRPSSWRNIATQYEEIYRSLAC